jgi:hypothetical protein
VAKPKRARTSPKKKSPRTATRKAAKPEAKKPAKKAAPKKPAKAASKKAAPKKAASKKAAPKKAVPKKAAPKPVLSQKALAQKAARQVRRTTEREPRAFIAGKVTTDALAEELAENAVRAMTTGEDEEGEREGERLAEAGGPFVASSGSREYARDDEAPNIRSAERAGRPTTRDERDDEEESDDD